MFFVISGYLISKNILFDLQLGKFSFKRFYLKRIRRLFPALLFTLLITMFAAYFFLANASMPRLGKVAAAAMLSVSNFFFLGEQGYFNTDASLKPLLHTWSLGVEEQFYLIWPFLLFVLYKLRAKAMWVIVLLLITFSIGGSFYFNAQHPNLVFFMLPFRLFEFLFGLFAFKLERKKDVGGFTRKAIILIGIFLIVSGFMDFSPFLAEHETIIDLSALNIISQVLCCLGVMLIISYGLAEKNLLKINFFDKPLAIIGTSSYSIYLVHWPLIVFYKMYKIDELVFLEKIVLFALSIVLGYLMWRFVENTFRYQENEKGIFRFKYFIPAGICVLVALVGFNVKGGNVMPEIKPAKSNKQAAPAASKELTEDNIESEMKRYWQEAEPNSPILKGTNGHDVIVMGNSHAVDLIYAFKRNGLEAEITSLPTTHLCYHFGAKAILPKDHKKCLQLKNKNLRNKKWKKADAIFLHDHWPVEETEALQTFVLELRKITKAPIYIFGPKMVFKSTIPQIVKASGTDDPHAINAFALKYSDLKKRSKYDQELNQVFESKNMKKQNIHYISLLNKTGLRQIMSPQNNDYYYFDKSHLTEKGAIQLGKLIKRSYPELFN